MLYESFFPHCFYGSAGSKDALSTVSCLGGDFGLCMFKQPLMIQTIFLMLTTSQTALEREGDKNLSVEFIHIYSSMQDCFLF